MSNRRQLMSAIPVLALMATIGFRAVEAQSIAGCSVPTVSMTPCLNFITGSTNGNASAPTSDCCTAVSAILDSGVTCFCQYITTSNPLGFPVNRTLGFSLPGLCKIKSSPLNQCQESAGVPFVAPAPSPGSSLAPAPTDGPTPSGRVIPRATSPARSPASLRLSPGHTVDSPAVTPAASGPARFTPSNTISPGAANRGIAPSKPRGIDPGTSGVAAVLPPSIITITIFAGLILANVGWCI